MLLYGNAYALTSGNTQSCGCYKNERLAEIGKARRTPNDYKQCDGYYIGYTKKGEEFYVDEDDFELINGYKWFIDKNGYVVSHPKDEEFVFMHRLIMGLNPNDNLEVDHIRGDTTQNDNRKINLRVVTHSKNQMNRKRQFNNTSSVIGVWYDCKRKKWIAEIVVDRKKYHLGSYTTIEEAQQVRREAENIMHGDYSYHNSQLEGNKRLNELERRQEVV